jgi:uncharacterized protein (TIGR03435 family)
LAVAAAASLLVAVGAAAMLARMWIVADTEALVEAVDGALHRLSGSGSEALRIGDRIRANEVLRTNGGAGAQLALTDGSRVEMRSQSELSLERTDDGLRIRLSNGGIIVNAVRLRAGHMYVQTKDMIVSVVGTVFLVSAEDRGSRVAVIEGEVRVQQGAAEKKLLPGQQMATYPLMAAPTLPEEFAWSRNAPEHLALLHQQSAVETPPAPPQSSKQPREAFEHVAIRPRPASGAGSGRSGSPFVSGLPPACGASRRIDPRRFLASNITVFELLTIAFDKECLFAEEAPEAAAGGLVGGPEWIRSVRYDIEAVRPDDPSDFTSRPYAGGSAQVTPGPKLRRMVQSMLADRFGLVVRREMRDMAVYELGVAQGGLKLPPQRDAKGFSSYVGRGGLYDAIKNGINPRPEYTGLIVGAISATGASMSDLAAQLTRLTGRPVLNRTGIEGVFTYEFFYAPAQFRSASPSAWARNPDDARPVLQSPSLFTVLEEELGLRLVETRGLVEVLAIERVERPSEN